LKFLAKTFGVLILLYCLSWAGLAAYFSFAERHKGLLEENLSSVFGRTVSIEGLQTTWVNGSPSLRITGLHVAGDRPNEAALSFASATAVVSPGSLFTFWPRFTDFAVERPSLEVVTLPNNKLQIAGITLSTSKGPGINRQKLLSWMLDQSNVAWHDGEIRWRKSDGTVQRYTDISFLYQCNEQSRLARGTITAPKGRVSATVKLEGDPLSTEDWDASVEVMSGLEQQLLKPGDLSFKVENGMGNIRLARLNVASIRDFLSLSGLADKTRWVLDAELSGLLHNVDFSFTGALTKLRDWSLKASATDVDFKSLDTLPALTNLNGDLEVNAQQGQFNFTAVDSTFEWSKLYDESFPISATQGRFTWQRNANGAFEIALNDGQFTDPNLSIYDVNAALTLETANEKVSTFGDLFKVESVNDLSFQGGDVIVGKPGRGPKPLVLTADARFNVSDMAALSAYLPNIEKLTLFRDWLSAAYKQGKMSNGRASYNGELSPRAMEEGKAQLNISADFDSVVVDYAPVLDWPPATDGRGSATLNNDFLTISPDTMRLNGDPVIDGSLTIEHIFTPDILLNVQGKVTTSLEKGMAFIFQGPLIAADKRPKVLPVEPTGGEVDIDVSLALPLLRLRDLSVVGTSTIRDGQVLLPKGVPLTDINAVVAFTEDTITSESITAEFLGGKTTARLVTTEQAQPPQMQLQGSGVGDLTHLSPWVGEHMLTWFSGVTPWQGTLDIDGANLVINGESQLVGIDVTAPAPLSKRANTPANFKLMMDLGGVKQDGTSSLPHLKVDYADLLHAEFKAMPLNAGREEPNLFDRALIHVGESQAVTGGPLPAGVNFVINHPKLDIEALTSSVIDLAQFVPATPTDNTDFLDALRSVSVSTPAAVLLNRPFGDLEVQLSSVDGKAWSGSLQGGNVAGSITMHPRDDIGRYVFALKKLTLGQANDSELVVDAIDKTLRPEDYPELALTVEQLSIDGRALGALDFHGRPTGDVWSLEKFALVQNGVRTTASGGWANDPTSGSLSSFDFSTTIDEAEGVLSELDFEGYIRKGEGSVNGTLEWSGAPHEFDYSRLDGKFDLFIQDGELVQVEPGGSGKLLGLLNFNTIARRLVFDFRDVFASGLQFDRMRYRGLLSNGEAILQEAFILTPAVFVRMEGKVNLDKELIDMDVHISPELGGNLTLLSALANPAAGAVVFLTSQIFKDDLRRASFKSFQAKGTWEDFEMVEIDSEGKPIEAKSSGSDEQEKPLS